MVGWSNERREFMTLVGSSAIWRKVELLGGLGRDELHRRALHRLGDRLRTRKERDEYRR
jgi:hypothetical protein